MLALHKILVPTDLSVCSTRALDEAHEFARQFSASIDLLYVWTMPALVAPESLITGMGINEQPLMAWMESSARELLSRFEEQAKNAGIEVNTSCCERGDPATTIVEHATQGGYDLLVLGTHGRTGIAHAVLGSVAEKVVRSAPCPVLTVRTTD
ncbi:MAG: universal stress protein [Polyangiaceae bacterium]